jgi:hypothetical protein
MSSVDRDAMARACQRLWSMVEKVVADEGDFSKKITLSTGILIILFFYLIKPDNP